MSIFLMMMATIFTQSQGAFSRARASVEMAREARAIFRFMKADLESALLVENRQTNLKGMFWAEDGNYDALTPPGPNPTTAAQLVNMEKSDPASASSDPDTDGLPKICFVSDAVQDEGATTGAGQPEPLQMRYRLEYARPYRRIIRKTDAGNDTARGVYRLVREFDKIYDTEYTGGAGTFTTRNFTDTGASPMFNFTADHHEVMGFNIVWIQYRFYRYDSANHQWSLTSAGDWSPTTALPPCVEVRLTLTDHDLRYEGQYACRFYLPAAAAQ